MKKVVLNRVGAFLLAAILFLMNLSSVSASFKGSSKAHKAYKAVVEKHIREKGIGRAEIFKNTETYATEIRYHNGVIAVFCEDFWGKGNIGDSTDELIVSWIDNASGSVVSAIYGYENGKAVEKGKFSSVKEFDSIAAWRQGDKTLFAYSRGRNYRNGLLFDGKSVRELHIAEGDNDNGMEGILSMAGMNFKTAPLVFRLHSAVAAGNHEYLAQGYEQKDMSLSECLKKLGIRANANSAANDAAKRRKAAEAFQSVGYWGDHANTKMTAEMAESYIQAIKDASGSKFILMDIAGDGIPVMLAVSLRKDNGYIDKIKVYHWDGQKVTHYPIEDKASTKFGYDFGYYNGVPAFRTHDEANGLGENLGFCVFKVSGGMVSKLVEYDGIYDYHLDENGGEIYYRYYKNGKEISSDDYPNHYNDSNWQRIYEIAAFGGWFDTVGNWSERNTMIEALSNYINGLSAYLNYERVDGVGHYYADEAGEAAWDAYKGKGEVTAIYEIVPNEIFYIIIEIGGVKKGVLVKGTRVNGEIKWNIAEKHDEPVEETALDKIAKVTTNKSNVVLDFGKISSFKKPKDFIAYLKDALDNMEGITPNDVAKGELVSFIESGISSICTGKVSGRNNRFTLNERALKDLVDEAKDIKEEVNELLSKKEISLGKETNIIVRLVWKNCKDKKPCSITLDSELYKELEGASVRLMLGKSGCFVQVSAENAKGLASEYPNMKIVFSKTGETTYAIQFETEKGEKIDKLPDPLTVTFGVPADSMICTVMASYSGGSDNWGGQFDQASGTLSFNTPYSGQYEVLENNIQIDDIGDLSEESQKAIRFLVSKGYLGLDGNNFLPNGTLSRYQFTQALVGMLFMLDRSETTTFTDVPEDSPYYAYVASAQGKNIVEGYDAQTFGGEINMSVEHMLALAGRTLVEQKAYSVPADSSEYLEIFTDRDKISERTAAHVALAIREGLFKDIETSESQKEITREQAAVILYRLFLLLYEVPPVDLDVPTGLGAILFVVIGGLVVLGAGVLVYVLKTKKKDEETETTEGNEENESIIS